MTFEFRTDEKGSSSAERAERRKVLLGISGSIGCYKACELARRLVSRGYEVRVVMTDSATKFVGTATFEAITDNPVVTDFWSQGQSQEIEHIALAEWADGVVIAPATANTLAKLASGQADNPLLAICLATRAPILVAPAMNCNMYLHPQTQENIAKLQSRGVAFVNPEEGELACGAHGVGRLANPWDIFHHVRRLLSSGDLRGKRVVVTTGPTREAMDPVRFISNRSSGKMGIALAREAFIRGADVTVIHGPVFVRVPSGVRCVPVISARDLEKELMERVFENSAPPDIVVMAAAVADFRPAEEFLQKVRKSEWPDSVKLTLNPDILGELGSRRGTAERPLLVGFAVETGDFEMLIERLRGKLDAKHVDLMVGNFAAEAFELDTNRVWIMERSGRYAEVATTFKSRVANKILDAVLRI